MSKIVFFCIPAHGHTNPTLNVVRELISMGHQVWYYSYNSMKDKITETGATFVSCDEYDMEQRLSPADGARIGKDLAFSTKILVDTTLALDEHIIDDMKQLKPDCIVADSMATWGKAIALKYQIPFVSSTTTFAFNKESAKVMKQGIGDLFKMLLSMPKIGKEIKRLQDKGYPIKSVLDIIQNDNNTHTIVYTSSQFQPCAETFSDKYVFVGPSIRPAQTAFEKTKDKLVYISMGTVNNDMLPFYKNCIQALTDCNCQVLISVGNMVSMEEFTNLPEHITVVSHVDQIAVLKKADVFLSHCGMNSASESLYFKVPLIMYPQTPEQSGVANRINQLEAGTYLEKTDATTIRHTIEKVLSDKNYKKNADMISEGFHACSGAKGAAKKIIEVCKG